MIPQRIDFGSAQAHWSFTAFRTAINAAISPLEVDHVESRDLLDLGLDVCGKSLLLKTQWWWGESGANSSLGVDPCSAGKVQGNSPKLDAATGTRAEFSETSRGGSN